MKIADGHVVALNYTLTLKNGEVVDSSDGQEPLLYLHGAGNIVPGLEAQLTGKAAGDKLTAVVQPADGYGDRDEDQMQRVPRTSFPSDIEIEPGMQFFAHTTDGDEEPIWIAEVDDETVVVDPNHPLAGEVLTFAVEVVSVRAATKEEMTHGHPHGEGGHDHNH